MALDIALPAALEENVEYGTKTYAIDWDKGRIYGTIDGLDALMQHCKKTLLTQRYKHMIYDDDIGSEHMSLVGADVPEDYIQSELERMIYDALIGDDRIIDIKDFSQDKSGQGRTLRFTVESIYGDTNMEVGVNV